jgi:hypothetical protein
VCFLHLLPRDVADTTAAARNTPLCEDTSAALRIPHGCRLDGAPARRSQALVAGKRQPANARRPRTRRRNTATERAGRPVSTARSTTIGMDREHPPSRRWTPAVKRGDSHTPTCEHGDWTFAGADYKRRATRWRCPTGECTSASTWVEADRLQSLIPRETESSAKLDRSRGAVAREFSSLKHEWALLPLRVRGLAKGPAARRPDNPCQARVRGCHSA